MSRWKNQVLTLDSNTANDNKPLINESSGSFISLRAVEPRASNQYPLTVVLGCADSDKKLTLNDEVSLQQWKEVVFFVTKVLLP